MWQRHLWGLLSNALHCQGERFRKLQMWWWTLTVNLTGWSDAYTVSNVREGDWPVGESSSGKGLPWTHQSHPISWEAGRDKGRKRKLAGRSILPELVHLPLLLSLLDAPRFLQPFSFPVTLQGASRPSSLDWDCILRMQDTPSGFQFLGMSNDWVLRITQVCRNHCWALQSISSKATQEIPF